MKRRQMVVSKINAPRVCFSDSSRRISIKSFSVSSEAGSFAFLSLALTFFDIIKPHVLIDDFGLCGENSLGLLVFAGRFVMYISVAQQVRVCFSASAPEGPDRSIKSSFSSARFMCPSWCRSLSCFMDERSDAR